MRFGFAKSLPAVKPHGGGAASHHRAAEVMGCYDRGRAPAGGRGINVSMSDRSDQSDLSDKAVAMPKSPACASAHTHITRDGRSFYRLRLSATIEPLNP